MPTQPKLTWPIVLTTLLLIAGGITTALGGFLGFLFRTVPALSATRTAGTVLLGLTALAWLILIALLDIRSALQPAAGVGRKLLYVLPIYFLGFTLVGVVLELLGIGTVGNFTTVWLAVGAALTLISGLIVAARIPLSARAHSLAIQILRAAGVTGVLAALALVATAGLTFTAQPATFGGNRNGQNNANPQANAPAAPAAPAQPSDGGANAGNNDGGNGGNGRNNAGGNRRQGGGFPGGERQFQRPSTTPFLAGGVVSLVLAVVQLLVAFRLKPTTAADPTATPTTPPLAPEVGSANYGRETGRAIGLSVALTVVGLLLAQAVPINRTNPPVQTPIQWNSEQTKDLAYRACMDCHSNETTWPWYSYVAPGSWLLASHVRDGREHLNLSELNQIPAERRAETLNEIAQQIRMGNMPPSDYPLIHPQAKLTAAERQQLIEGFQLSLGNTLTTTASAAK